MTDPGIAPPHEFPAGTGLMAAALLHDLVRWREALARSLARNNLALRSNGIMTAANRILLPLLLLRTAEDRSIVPAGTLEDLRDLRTVPAIIGHLSEYADVLYAGSFLASLPHQDPGTAFVAEDRIVRTILDQITAPERRYHLAAMETPAIANVLTQYLSRTVRRSAAHMATVVDTHDTVLAGGTTGLPLPLAEYLVRGAVLPALKNRSSREVLPLRILDPACGAGTLLLVVYRRLLEDSGGPALSLDERREILLHSVHGLDLNPHAVAAARMLLVLELFGNTEGNTRPVDFPDAAQRDLAALQHTVLCGNALVGPEIEADESWMFCPARDRHSLRPFSYRETFPEIIVAGGFDCVICNPPEGPLEQREWIQQYFQRRYAAYHPLTDRSAYFLEKALALLMPGGTAALILGNRWLRGAAGSPLRELVAARHIEEIADLAPLPAGTPGAGLALIRVRATRPARSFAAIAGTALFAADPAAAAPALRFPVRQQDLDSGGWSLADTRAGSVVEKMFRHGTRLADVVMGQVHPGLQVREGDPFLIDAARAREWIRRDPRCRPLLRPIFRAASSGTGIEPAGTFRLLVSRDWTSAHPGAAANPWKWLRHRHPYVARHLRPHAELLRESAGTEALWWETDADEFWARPRRKIFFCPRSLRPEFRFDSGRGIGDESLCAFPVSGTYLAGILNSRLIAFAITRMREQNPADFFTWRYLGQVPVIVPDLDTPTDRARHDRLETLVQKRTGLEQQLSGTSDAAQRGALEKKIRTIITATDAQVYELYRLTPEEIAVVEGHVSS